ncbi:MAG: DUF4280 domain-containing protein, partial [Paludibacteraceae bacterium]|nr:DUF4280 domain-containing protein [Paludibacteraceae bacterium]
VAQKQSSIRFERNRLKETNEKINELEVEPCSSTSVNHEEIKQQYVEALNAEIEKDKKLLEDQNKKVQAMIKEFNDHKIKYTFFDHNKLYYEIRYQQQQIENTLQRLQFNITNLDNTVPPPPPPPPPTPPPGPAPSAPLVQKFVSMGAKLTCPFAMGGQSSLVVQRPMCLLENAPWANIMDYKPLVNIPTFGMCNSLANPMVAAATAAAMGALTPQACTPNIVAPWQPGKMDVLVENQPALLNTSTCQCTWGGVITILP